VAVKMAEGYLQTETDGGRAYIRAGRSARLRGVGAVIFDCDGVLIDIRESCNRAIPETVAYILRELTGAEPPANLVSREVVYLFKRGGGFNNDWDLAYAVLSAILCWLPDDFQRLLMKHVAASQSENDFRRFLSVKEGIRRELDPGRLELAMSGLGGPLRRLAEASDVSGFASVERRLMDLSGAPARLREFSTAVKRLLAYPGGVGESLLTAVFEEIFCGSRLFEEVYRRESRLNLRRGLIEDERVILRPGTLDRLASALGGANFGIASGRYSAVAGHTLGGLLGRFSPEARVFLDEIEAAEREARRGRGGPVSLKKPNPFSLLESSKGLRPFGSALYVGDSMEDALVVGEANRVDPRFLFAGVYGHSDRGEDVLRDFLGAGAEIVLPSVNELPALLWSVRGSEEA